jgi:hypothetical protein
VGTVVRKSRHTLLLHTVLSDPFPILPQQSRKRNRVADPARVPTYLQPHPAGDSAALRIPNNRTVAADDGLA